MVGCSAKYGNVIAFQWDLTIKHGDLRINKRDEKLRVDLGVSENWGDYGGVFH